MPKLKNPLVLRCFDFQSLKLLGNGVDVYCCVSCHEEEDGGYFGMLEIQPPSKKDRKKRWFSTWNDSLYAQVCCVMHTLLERVTRHQWAQVAREHRKRERSFSVMIA